MQEKDLSPWEKEPYLSNMCNQQKQCHLPVTEPEHRDTWLLELLCFIFAPTHADGRETIAANSFTME